MLTQFKLPYENPDYSPYCDKSQSATSIEPLSQINYFIGPNNSGKSRLLRQLLKDLFKYEVPKKAENPYQATRQGNQRLSIFRISHEFVLQKLNQYIYLFSDCILKESSKTKLDLLFKQKEGTFYDEFELMDYYNTLNTNLSDIFKDDFNKVSVQTDSQEKKRNTYVQQLFSKILFEVGKFFPVTPEYQFTYVPAFRTLRKFLLETKPPENKEISFSLYKERYYELIEEKLFNTRVVFDYFQKTDIGGDVEFKKERPHQVKPSPIFTGETLFNDIRKLRNSGEKDRKILIDFEKFLSDAFFESKVVELNALDINEIKDIYIKIGSESEFPIYHLGDGIQAIILLTFPLFIYRDCPHQIFYEEPELFLHPGMQRVFIDTLIRFDKTQAHIATHSNHFLDTSLDYPEKVSIFSLKKNLGNEGLAEFRIENLSSPKVSLLNELGVRNSSILIANCTIWVEGISDRLYLKRYLDIYQRENPDQIQEGINLKEDLHYSFFEYGGNNIVHYNFLDDNQPLKINATKIANRIFLIHDQDKGKQKRHSYLKQQLVENYYDLPVLEMENLLTSVVLQATLKSFRADDEMTILPFVDNDYKMVPLGVFVKKHVPKGLKKIFTSKAGSQPPRLYNKLNFAQKALEYITKWSDMSSEAQELTRRMLKFVEKNNTYH